MHKHLNQKIKCTCIMYITYKHSHKFKRTVIFTWTSCLIPLAATRPGSCLMVGWADPEDIAAEARVAKGSTNRAGNNVPSQHTGSTISTLYYSNIVLYQHCIISTLYNLSYIFTAFFIHICNFAITIRIIQ